MLQKSVSSRLPPPGDVGVPLTFQGAPSYISVGPLMRDENSLAEYAREPGLRSAHAG